MAFRWFRQNKEATKWIYIFITIFVMLTFSITGAMVSSFGGRDKASVSAGSFRNLNGETVDISQLEYHNISQVAHRLAGRNMTEEAVWSHIMLDRLGRDAGIQVSDRMLGDFMRTQAGVTNDEQYRQLLASRRLSPAEFEEFLRADLRGNLYRQLNAPPQQVLSEEVFSRFQQDNELLKVRYVSFSEAAERERLKAEAVDDEALKKFYDEELDANVKKNDFSTPEMFSLRAGMFDAGERSADDLRALLSEPMRDVPQALIDNYKTRFADRYKPAPKDDATQEGEAASGDDKPKDPGADDDADAADGEDADEDGEEDGEDADEVEDPAVAAELNSRIEKDVLADRVVSEAYRDFFQAKRERDDAKRERDERKAKEAAAGDTAAAKTPEELAAIAARDAIADRTFADLLQPTLTKYALRVIDLPGPTAIADLKDLPEIGSDDLQFTVRFMSAEEVRPRPMSPTVKSPYLLLCDAKVDAKPLPFDEVKDRLKDAWVDQKATSAAQAAADGFMDGMRARAREQEKGRIDEIEQRAADEAAKEIAEKAITDEAEQQKVREARLAAVKPEIDAIVNGVLGSFFTAEAGARGLTPLETAPFRKSYFRTAFYRDDKASIDKFLQGRSDLFALSDTQVMGPVRDPESKAVVVAQVAERSKPDETQMRLADRLEAAYAVRNDKFGPMFAGMPGMPPGMMPQQEDPFSYDALALKLALTRPQPEQEAKE